MSLKSVMQERCNSSVLILLSIIHVRHRCTEAAAQLICFECVVCFLWPQSRLRCDLIAPMHKCWRLHLREMFATSVLRQNDSRIRTQTVWVGFWSCEIKWNSKVQTCLSLGLKIDTHSIILFSFFFYLFVFFISGNWLQWGIRKQTYS